MANSVESTKKPVRLNMTGEEFKKLIEKTDTNGTKGKQIQGFTANPKKSCKFFSETLDNL